MLRLEVTIKSLNVHAVYPFGGASSLSRLTIGFNEIEIQSKDTILIKKNPCRIVFIAGFVHQNFLLKSYLRGFKQFLE